MCLLTTMKGEAVTATLEKQLVAKKDMVYKLGNINSGTIGPIPKKDLLIKVLRLAKERVSKGWIKGEAMNEDGTRVCAGQAVAMACTDLKLAAGRFAEARMDPSWPGTWLLRAAIERTGCSWGSIPHWNDANGRDRQDVLDTFDYAIKTVERDFPDA